MNQNPKISKIAKKKDHANLVKIVEKKTIVDKIIK
jgi:hypothetical protein